MANSFKVEIPDIGNFDSVEVIDILVNEGDKIVKEDALITVESDKASMDIPSPTEGIIKKILVKVGDKVKQGSVVLETENVNKQETNSSDTSKKVDEKETLDKSKPTTQPNNDLGDGKSYDVAVLGSGPGGYTAAFRAADLGKSVVLIERYTTIGGVCLNVGCIPSKALLHTAKVITDAEDTSSHGVAFSTPEINLEKLRDWKSNKVVKKLTMGLAQMAKQREVDLSLIHI